MQGIDAIHEILGRRNPKPTGSGLLDAVSAVKFDRHDVTGCATLAKNALAAIDAEDPTRDALAAIAGTACSDNRLAQSYMNGIFKRCEDGISAHAVSIDEEPSATFGR